MGVTHHALGVGGVAMCPVKLCCRACPLDTTGMGHVSFAAVERWLRSYREGACRGRPDRPARSSPLHPLAFSVRRAGSSLGPLVACLADLNPCHRGSRQPWVARVLPLSADKSGVRGTPGSRAPTGASGPGPYACLKRRWVGPKQCADAWQGFSAMNPGQFPFHAPPTTRVQCG
jgi:hypothetical protein